MPNMDPTKTGYTRVFLIEGRARSDRQPSYESFMKMMGVDYAFGDVEDIKIPHPNNYDMFNTIGEIRGEEERPSTSLVGRYAADLRSALLRLAKLGCPNDIQLHIGKCTDASEFDTFQKAIIMEAVMISNYSTDDLGALQPDERSVINETGDISSRELYEVMPLLAREVAGDVVLNEVIDVVFCDLIQCGECDTLSDGCQQAFAVTLSVGGSPGTPGDVIHTPDGGSTWYADDIDSLGNDDDPSALACVGLYVVVVSNDDCALHYAPRADFNVYTDPAFARVATGFVAIVGCPNDIWSVGPMAFVVGDGGYVYTLHDPTAGVAVVDAGVAAGGSNLNAVHALNESFAVAVGLNGTVIYTENQTLWAAPNAVPVGIGIHLMSVWVKSELEWWVGTDDGRVFITYNKGETWEVNAFPGSGTGIVWDIAFSTASVVYIAHETAADLGRVLRSYNGGNSWMVVPEGTTAMPANDRIVAIAACVYDANEVIGVGLSDLTADGFVVVLEI